MLKWFRDEENYWLKDFAITQNISRQRISEFSKSNEYFNYINSLCKDMQESKLVKLGLNKNINSSMPIFALKNVCKWTDKQETDITLPTEIIIELPSSFTDED